MVPGRVSEAAAGDPNEEQPGSAPSRGADALTHFNFQHKAFAAPGARFAIDRNSREPAYYVTLGELPGSVEIAALKSVATQIREIRLRRDALYMLLLDWKETIADFEAWAPVRTPRTDKAVNALYRFLAPRFTSGKSLFNKRR